MRHHILVAAAVVAMWGAVGWAQPQAPRPQPGLKWSEAELQQAASYVRAGRVLTPKSWPGGARVAVCLSFDPDNFSSSLNRGRTGPAAHEAQNGSRPANPIEHPDRQAFGDTIRQLGVAADPCSRPPSEAVTPGWSEIAGLVQHAQPLRCGLRIGERLDKPELEPTLQLGMHGRQLSRKVARAFDASEHPGDPNPPHHDGIHGV